MLKCPCEECLVFIMCKQRIKGSISELGFNEKCNLLNDFWYKATQKDVNGVRKLFGLGPIDLLNRR